VTECSCILTSGLLGSLFLYAFHLYCRNWGLNSSSGDILPYINNKWLREKFLEKGQNRTLSHNHIDYSNKSTLQKIGKINVIKCDKIKVQQVHINVSLFSTYGDDRSYLIQPPQNVRCKAGLSLLLANLLQYRLRGLMGL